MQVQVAWGAVGVAGFNFGNYTSLIVSTSPLWTREILERIATEFNQLQFHAVQSKGLPLLDKVRPRIAHITAMLQQFLGGLLLEGLQTSNVDIIWHCLRTYATIDKTRDAEALVGQVLVKPYMDEVCAPCTSFRKHRASNLASFLDWVRESSGLFLEDAPSACSSGCKKRLVPLGAHQHARNQACALVSSSDAIAQGSS
ncbi:conserved oligomeric Golgi complex subunit 2-like isoform X1 [Mustela lutreola]|uniref:conserved oligomeric Golgi complex subunit 2-like isoform X1 n=1 Tax=Mustela lutreola TaxID=9666 RepID=UPI00279731E7|nr:conserved oligomeric Golgi complex subunit 2-like isoform X1 [Mustela lutreola]